MSVSGSFGHWSLHASDAAEPQARALHKETFKSDTKKGTTNAAWGSVLGHELVLRVPLSNVRLTPNRTSAKGEWRGSAEIDVAVSMRFEPVTKPNHGQQHQNHEYRLVLDLANARTVVGMEAFNHSGHQLFASQGELLTRIFLGWLCQLGSVFDHTFAYISTSAASAVAMEASAPQLNYSLLGEGRDPLLLVAIVGAEAGSPPSSLGSTNVPLIAGDLKDHDGVVWLALDSATKEVFDCRCVRWANGEHFSLGQVVANDGICLWGDFCGPVRRL